MARTIDQILSVDTLSKAAFFKTVDELGALKRDLDKGEATAVGAYVGRVGESFGVSRKQAWARYREAGR